MVRITQSYSNSSGESSINVPFSLRYVDLNSILHETLTARGGGATEAPGTRSDFSLAKLGYN